MSTSAAARSLPATLLPRTLMTVALGLMLFVFILGAAMFSFRANYDGRIYPGVSVAGIDVSSRTPEDAANLLLQQLDYTLEGQIAFQDNSSVWAAKPAEIGLFFDANATVRAAYQVGRTGGLPAQILAQYRIWSAGQDLAPILVYDEASAETYLNGLAEIINRSTVEASLGLDGIEVIVNSGQVGRTLDVPATLAALAPQLESLTDGLIPLVVHETPPIILDATEQAELAKRILNAPLVLSLPDGETGAGPWTFDQETLAGMLSIEQITDEAGDAIYQIGINSEELRAFLEDLAPALAVTPVNARFYFDDDTQELVLIKNSTTGRTLLVDETVTLINQKLAEGEHDLALLFDYHLPAAPTDSTTADLGITELVSAHTSYFYGSSNARIQNIQTAASTFHGILIAPGETFSMASILGDISLDNGYAEALIIFGDRTIKGVGGGVCQVSTTLFRTAFFGGYQIEERHPHAYRVYYYELSASGSVNTNMAGLDATVYVPLVDFKFTNDTNNWLLMETYVNVTGRSLTWKFYSTSDGRTVEWATTGLQNRVEPPKPLYQENPALAKGEIKQVDWAVDGADVTVTRTVLRGDTTIHEDVFRTRYQPWRAVYEYGPGTKDIPKDDKEQD